MRSPSLLSAPSFDRNNGRYRDARVLQSFHPTSMTELDYQTEVLVDITSSCHLLLKDKVPTLGNSED